jgi:methylenetetrahydrofolate dehydrogenase (NAD+)
MSSEVSGKGLLLKAESIANTFCSEVKETLSSCSPDCRPKLVGILATTSAPCKFYADFTKKQCEDLGVEFVLKKTGAADNGYLGEGEGAEEAIIEANEDDTVDGIMVCSIYSSKICLRRYELQVYYPIFGPQQVRAFTKRNVVV